MRSRYLPFLLILLTSCLSFNCLGNEIDSLRDIYSQPPEKWPKPDLDDDVKFNEIGLLGDIVFPADNPFSKAKMALGETLFNDGRLSRSQQIACASCHDRDLAWADGRRKSFGHNRQLGKRNAPTIENIGFNQHFFWDGRAATLEAQALAPIQDPLEMNFTLPELEARLATIEEYKAAFKDVFGDEKITADRIAKALATFQRTIISRKSDFDFFIQSHLQKKDRIKEIYKNKLSDQAILGLHLFRTKARCMNCHSGPNFTDQKFHNIGLTFYQRKHEDLGRYNVTGDPNDVGKFKTPSLRNVMNTAPWMHNGLFVSMPGVINIYNAGGAAPKKNDADPMHPKLSPHLQPLGLTKAEIAALQAFLESITTSPARGPARQFRVAK